MVLGLSLVAISGLVFMAADHADAPAVTGNANDITKPNGSFSNDLNEIE